MANTLTRARLVLVVVASAVSLSACMSTSFAAPEVQTRYRMKAASPRECSGDGDSAVEIKEDVAGALRLIDNHSEVYDCAMRVTADGRQLFQIPSFLALVGATTAVAFGAGPNVAIAGNAASSVFTAGNNYYAPAEQSAILRDAFNAVSCIGSEAVGIPSYASLQAEGERQRQAATNSGGSVTVTSDQRYYRMIKYALDDVRSSLADRLGRRGSFDAAGVAAQIRAFAEEERQREAAAAAQRGSMHSPALREDVGENSRLINLELDALQPKLLQCALMAKA